MDNAELAHAMFDALDAGDFERFVSFFTEDAVVWHNYDNINVPVAETAAVLGQLRAQVKNPRYEDRRYLSVPGGAIAQHVLRATGASGNPVELPAMMRIFVEDGRVRRIEEYFDISQAAKLTA